MVIIICVRLLNLAVPILYKKVLGVRKGPLCTSAYLSPLPCHNMRWLIVVHIGQVVDVLADITNGTHPRPGDKPEHYKFMQAFYPYVLLYIAAYFFQVLCSGAPAPIGCCAC